MSMLQFQAQTSPALDQELERLRERLRLRPNQEADLLRELVALASWLIRQTEEGRTIEAHGDDDDVQVLAHPSLERLRREMRPVMERIALGDAEVERLAAILDRREAITPELMETLRRLSDPERKPPTLTWNDE